MNLGLLHRDGECLRLTKQGQLRNAEAMFYLSEQKALEWDHSDPEYDLLRRYEFFPDVSRDNQLLFEKLVRGGGQQKLAA